MSDLYSCEPGFLAATTGLPSESSNWDDYVVSQAAACASSGDISRTHTSLDANVSHQITNVSERLIDTFSKFDKYQNFLNCRDDKARDLLDILQKLLDHDELKPGFRKILYVALVRLCRKSQLYPPILSLEGVTDMGEGALTRGTFGDIWKARYNGNDVCLKSVKIYLGNRDPNDRPDIERDTRKQFFREAVVWAQLSHANILPFYGIFFFETLSLVSPWIPNGNVHEYLNLKDKSGANRPHLISGVADGMKYLHQNGVAHGDLKCSNVLVANPEQALLTDFGFSYVTDSEYTDPKGFTGQLFSSAHIPGGTRAFEAPERDSSKEKVPRRDGKSDVFAFGMLCYEMFSSPTPPRSDLDRIYWRIVDQPDLLPDMQPEHPEKYEARGLTDDVWALMKECWSYKPEDRPSSTQIVNQLRSMSFGRPRDPDIISPKIRPGFALGDNTITKALRHLQTL